MLKIEEINVMDTVIFVEVTLDLDDGTDLNLEVHLGVDFRPEEMIIQPTRFGSVIGRDPGKTLELAHCIGDDRSGNPLTVVQELAKKVDVGLDYFRDEDDLAIWNIRKALLPHFHVDGNSIPDRFWIAETVRVLIDGSFPAEMLKQDAK